MQTVYLQMRNGNRNSFRSYSLCLSSLPLTDLYSLRNRREWVPVRTSVSNASAKSRAGREKNGESHEGIRGFAAKSFARATTPASYAGYGPYIASNVLHSTYTSFITDGVHNENVVLPVYHKDPKYACKVELYSTSQGYSCLSPRVSCIFSTCTYIAATFHLVPAMTSQAFQRSI